MHGMKPSGPAKRNQDARDLSPWPSVFIVKARLVGVRARSVRIGRSVMCVTATDLQFTPASPRSTDHFEAVRRLIPKVISVTHA